MLLVVALGCGQATPSPTAASTGNELTVIFVDVGQGDAILLRSPEGKTMLIDGGERDSGIVAKLKALGVKELDVVVGTHPHTDHIGGLIEVLKRFPVKEVWSDGQLHTTKTFEDFLAAIQSSKAVFHEARRGDIIRLGSLSLKVLHPRKPFLEEGNNNNAVVLYLGFGQVSFLFMADAEKAAERDMLRGNLGVTFPVTVLKVGHHGSAGASSPEFLTVVRPKVAIYQAGQDNPYDHPHRETIAALKAIGAAIYGTDVNGTITVTTGGDGYRIAVKRQR